MAFEKILNIPSNKKARIFLEIMDVRAFYVCMNYDYFLSRQILS